MNKSEVVHSVFNSRESDVDDSLVNDRFKISKGFYAVPPPYTGNYMPPRPDLSVAGLDESVFQSAVRKTTTSMPETETSISKTSKDIVEKPKTVRPSAPIIEEWDTDSDNDSVFRPKSDQTKQKFTKINFVKSAVTTKPGQVPVNAAKQSSPRAAASISTARPVNTAASKPKVKDALPITYYYFNAHSPIRRDFNQKSAAKTNNFNEKVNTARVNNVTTARPKAVVSDAEGNRENAVKSSACWIWRPTGNVIDHIFKDSRSYMLKRFNYGNPQYTFQDQGIFDSGCFRHMTGNKSFLTDYQKIDGGFVTFGGSPKGGKITSKGKIRTGKLDFEDVYFVKELEFNLFSVSQMCDKKNSVLFTKIEWLVLSPDFNLLDESQVLLKVPKHENMYSFDLKNVVPLGGRKPALSFMRPFGCPVTILNTLDHLANIDEEQEEYRQFWSTICNPTHFDLLDSHPSKEIMKMNLVEMKLERNPGREKAQSNEFESVFGQDKDANGNSIYKMFTLVNAAGSSCDNLGGSIHVNAATLPNADLPTDPLMLDLEDTANLLNTSIFSGAYDDEDVGAEADLNNLETTMNVSPIPTTRIHKDHPKEQIRGYPLSAPQTRRMTKSAQEHYEPKKVFRNKKDERGIIVRNKVRLVAQGYTQEEGMAYDEVFAPVARIEAIRLFLAYASFMRFIVYQMDVKSAFLYGTIEEE
ncbi:ribonuclease H-like domain-containing protein, partial [Tanacetum coccineum]